MLLQLFSLNSFTNSKLAALTFLLLACAGPVYDVPVLIGI